MKKLNLENASYRYLVESFKDWLDVQGYSKSTVYNLPNHIRELLHHLEDQGVTNIKDLKPAHIEKHYQKLRERSNQRRGGGLSVAHLNKHLQAIRKFTDYLRKAGRLEIQEPNLEIEKPDRRLIYLTEDEIRELFQATQKTPIKNKSEEVKEAIQSRDRAMLAIFYGCGLRRSEGVGLDVSDINFDKSILHVRKGKNYKERLVPISKTSLKHLTSYIYDHRSVLTGDSKADALFVAYTTKTRMQGQSLFIRLKLLQYHTENSELQEKEIGLHTLRHSIATHLLAAGMKLESISRFLGHSSLESTQIYTHLLSEDEIIKDQPFNLIPHREYGKLHEDEF